MELGTQIKKYRTAENLSQEELAEKIYVSRQSVSNWETGKTYPDIRSLLLLGDVFHISLDELVKGDLEQMKLIVTEEERKDYRQHLRAVTVLSCITIPIFALLMALHGFWGILLSLPLQIPLFYFEGQLQKQNKKYDISTIREILAFREGKTLDEIEKAQEAGKRPYQKFILSVGNLALGALLAVLACWLVS